MSLLTRSNADPSLTPSRRPTTLADLLTKDRKSSMAYDYMRDSPLISSILVSPKSYTTFLVPTNSAIMSLTRKPHQGPAPVVGGEVISIGIESDKEHEEKLRAYLERWVMLHVVPGPVDERADNDDGKEYPTMVEGRSVSFVKAIDGPGAVLVMPGNIRVAGVLEVRPDPYRLPPRLASLTIVLILQASNGKLIFIDGSLTLDL